MTDDKKIAKLLSHADADEQTIEKLIRLGGQREEIDPACTARVRDRVYQAWLEKHGQNPKSAENETRKQRHAQRINKRTWFPFAGLAASVLLGLMTISILLQRFHDAPAVVATVKTVQGKVTQDGAPLTSGSEVSTGQPIKTGDTGGLAIVLANGSLVKMDRLTQARFTGPQDLELMTGAVYFDSQEKGNIRVHTVRGLVRDIGTRFETRLSHDELLVRVRDGKVRVDQAKTAVFVASGQALQLTDGAASVTEIPAGDPWLWADAMDDNFSLADRSMAEILAWISRREGWTLRYRHETDQQRARADIIRGRLSISDSEDMLQQLSLISDMRFHFDDQILVISYPQ